MLAIRNVRILSPAPLTDRGTILMNNGRIRAVGPADEIAIPDGSDVIDAAGLTAVPGLIDLQFNGAFGHDFTADPTTIWDVAAALPRYGVTAFLPTIITSPLNTVSRAQAVLAEGPPPGFGGARPIGLHVEGPFLNPGKKGAHNPVHLRLPSPEAVADWSPETGVRLVTLAPELPGALEVVGLLASRGVLVSAGHSLATYEEAQAGFDAGIRYATHLFNAMPPFHHRDPGLIAAALLDERVTVGIMADGLHVHPAPVEVVWRVAGPDRVNVVTDAMAALGMPPGSYWLGDYATVVDEIGAQLPDGTLAGCILPLDAVIRNFVAYSGCSLFEALTTITTTPARLLGVGHERGTLTVGAAADVVLMTSEMQIKTTLIDGRPVFSG
jgi:N-acetylglucosamine-6-phosphate deacetylase